jgi:hypothetical protein
MPWADDSRRVYADVGEFVRIQVTNASSQRTEKARATRQTAKRNRAKKKTAAT